MSHSKHSILFCFFAPGTSQQTFLSAMTFAFKTKHQTMLRSTGNQNPKVRFKTRNQFIIRQKLVDEDERRARFGSGKSSPSGATPSNIFSSLNHPLFQSETHFYEYNATITDVLLWMSSELAREIWNECKFGAKTSSQRQAVTLTFLLKEKVRFLREGGSKSKPISGGARSGYATFVIKNLPTSCL